MRDIPAELYRISAAISREQVAVGHGMEKLKILPSRDYGYSHGMEEMKILPSRALHIGDMWVTGWKIECFCHPVIKGMVTRWKNERFCHPVRYISGIHRSRDGLKRVNSIA